MKRHFIRESYYIEYDDNSKYKDTSFKFELYAVACIDQDGNPLYEASELIVRGYLKWDGCWNIHFNQDDTMFHICDINDHCKLMLELHDFGKSQMSKWDGDK